MRLTRNFEDNPRLFKYQLKLQGYDMAIIYRPGKTNLNADFLSRLPEFSPDKEPAGHALAVTKATTEEAPWVEEPYVQTMSPDTLPDLQRQDKELKSMIRYLVSGNLPTDPGIANKVQPSSDSQVTTCTRGDCPPLCAIRNAVVSYPNSLSPSLLTPWPSFMSPGTRPGRPVSLGIIPLKPA